MRMEFTNSARSIKKPFNIKDKTKMKNNAWFNFYRLKNCDCT